MKNLVWTIGFLFLLSACVGLRKETLEAVERGEKAMIVSKCVASTPPVGVIIKDYDPVGCITTWTITGGRHDGVVEVIGSLSQNVSIDIIAPGKYSLSGIRAENHDFWNSYTDVYKVGALENIATFEVQGGEVIYIGDINLNLRNSALIAKAISLNNSTPEAAKAVAKNYPNFAGRFRTQLLELTPYVYQVKNLNNTIDTNFTKK